MGKTGVKLRRTPSYPEAEMIVGQYQTSRRYLRELVLTYIGDEEAINADYAKLRYYGHVIRGVCNNILETRPEKKEESPSNSQESLERQLHLFR
ncbi:MAG: hypothetical protein KKF68_01995 [Nanoarchaeota archaeon]|nr:hypothetical protein [Nanoarchaeota archaeon]